MTVQVKPVLASWLLRASIGVQNQPISMCDIHVGFVLFLGRRHCPTLAEAAVDRDGSYY